jgi:hypothetical protein
MDVEQTTRSRASSNGLCCAQERSFPMDPHERPVVTEENKVAMRGGVTGNHVRYVLIASMALVIVAFIAIALFVKA